MNISLQIEQIEGFIQEENFRESETIIGPLINEKRVKNIHQLSRYKENYSIVFNQESLMYNDKKKHCFVERNKGGKYMKEVNTVKSVDRALEVLNILQSEPQGIGVTRLSEKLGVSKSTAHRLLMSLLNKNFVHQDAENQRYYLGLRLMELGQTVTDQLDIRQLASPFLHRLVGETGETAHLVIRDKSEIVYIDKIENSTTIRMFSNIGKRAPMHCTGVGKAILAFLPEERIHWVIDQRGLPRFTDTTITDREELLAHLKEIRSRGYSIDDEEHEEGIKCAAAPILNSRGEVVAGISVAGPIMRVNDNNIDQIAQHVLQAAQDISRSLGGNV